MKKNLINFKYNQAYHKTIITLVICVFVVTLTIAYGAYQSEYKISGDAIFQAQRDVRITDIELLETTNEGIEEYNPSYNVDTINTSVVLLNDDSSVTYKIEITNYSDIGVVLQATKKEIYNNNEITYSFDKTLPLLIEPLEKPKY